MRPKDERLPFTCELNFTAAGGIHGNIVQVSFGSIDIDRQASANKRKRSKEEKKSNKSDICVLYKYLVSPLDNDRRVFGGPLLFIHDRWMSGWLFTNIGNGTCIGRWNVVRCTSRRRTRRLFQRNTYAEINAETITVSWNLERCVRCNQKNIYTIIYYVWVSLRRLCNANKFI